MQLLAFSNLTQLVQLIRNFCFRSHVITNIDWRKSVHSFVSLQWKSESLH